MKGAITNGDELGGRGHGKVEDGVSDVDESVTFWHSVLLLWRH